jgi:hypothetical protein
MFSRGLIALMFLASLVPAGADEGQPLSEAQLTEFLGPGITSSMTWTMVPAVDFVVYRGRPLPPLTGGVGIYLGGWPAFKPESSAVIVPGQLGIFPVKWYRTVSAKGEIRQEALIPLDEDYLKAHVWIEAERQPDLDKLLGEVSRLPTFSFKHESPFHDFIVRERRARLAASVVCPLLLGISVWLLDRFLRRKKESAIRRGLALVVISASWMLLVAGIGPYLIDVVGLDAARWGFWIMLGLAAISLIAGLLLAGVSFTRRRLRGKHPV